MDINELFDSKFYNELNDRDKVIYKNYFIDLARSPFRALNQEEREIYGQAAYRANNLIPSFRDAIAMLRPFVDVTCDTAYIDRYSRVGLSYWFFWYTTDVYERATILIHESMHVLYNHFSRAETAGVTGTPFLYGTDLEINSIIQRIPRTNIEHGIKPSQFELPDLKNMEFYSKEIENIIRENRNKEFQESRTGKGNKSSTTISFSSSLNDRKEDISDLVETYNGMLLSEDDSGKNLLDHLFQRQINGGGNFAPENEDEIKKESNSLGEDSDKNSDKSDDSQEDSSDSNNSENNDSHESSDNSNEQSDDSKNDSPDSGEEPGGNDPGDSNDGNSSEPGDAESGDPSNSMGENGSSSNSQNGSSSSSSSSSSSQGGIETSENDSSDSSQVKPNPDSTNRDPNITDQDLAEATKNAIETAMKKMNQQNNSIGEDVNECDEASPDRESGADEAGIEKVSSAEQNIAKKNTMQRLREENMKGQGSGTSDVFMNMSLQLMAPPKADWRKILRGVVASFYSEIVLGHSYTNISRVNKRYSQGNMIIPATIDFIPRIMVGCDTSGSMGKVDYFLGLSETEGIIKASVKGRSEISFFPVDTEVKGIQKVSNINDIDLSGGGGTDMSVAFEYVNTLKEKEVPNIFILITDGGTNWDSIVKQLKRKEAKKYKSIILVTQSYSLSSIPPELHRYAKIIDIT